jgi:hypothetical protein
MEDPMRPAGDFAIRRLLRLFASFLPTVRGDLQQI